MTESARSEKHRILVLAEKGESSISPNTLESLEMARKIADQVRGILCVAVVGHDTGRSSEEIAPWADEVYALRHNLLKSFQPELYAAALEQLCRKIGPYLVLSTGTLNALDVAPRLGGKMDVEVMTDCIDLAVEPETGHLLCTKPVFGSKVISTFTLERKPLIAMLRPKTSKPAEPGPERGKIIPFEPVLDESLARVRFVEYVKGESIDLGKAEVIVAGGRGVKDAGGLEQLNDLIKTLKKYFGKVELGASRPLIDARLLPSSRQIGLTGEKVAPEIYIAVGISGSLQHVTGMLGSKKIIAINSSPKAYIFAVADYGVVGPFEEVVPAFNKKLEELK